MASVGTGLHSGESVDHWFASGVITSHERRRSSRAGDDYNKISLGYEIETRFVGITEAAENAGGDGKDAENGGLHCGIEMFFLAEEITVELERIR